MKNYKQLTSQFIKFCTVGFIGTAVDFALLNLLSWATGIVRGNGLIPINIISFSCAFVLSFFLNKLWTFQDSHRHDYLEKFSLFLVISLIGVSLNTLIVRYVSTNIDPLFGLSDREWLNLAKAFATIFSGLWNFSGYKLVVFKK